MIALPADLRAEREALLSEVLFLRRQHHSA